MHNPLPEANLHEVFSHPEFDALFSRIKWPNAVGVKVIIDGNTNGSDIRWNNLSGKWRLAVLDANARELGALIGCQIDCFTGNCGIKAIDHLYMHHTFNETKDQENEMKSKLIKIMESFLYYKTNCGLLIGSDTYGKEFKGNTIMILETYGKGYKISEPTWNPNYTWNKKHTIALFHKDLNETRHDNYWS